MRGCLTHYILKLNHPCNSRHGSLMGTKRILAMYVRFIFFSFFITLFVHLFLYYGFLNSHSICFTLFIFEIIFQVYRYWFVPSCYIKIVWFQTGLYGFLEATFFPYWLRLWLRLHSQQAKRYPILSYKQRSRSNKNLKWSGLGWVIHQYVGRNTETFLNSCYCLWCGWSSHFERFWKMMLYFIFRFSSTLTFICIWKQSPRPFISPWHPRSRVRKNGV